MADDGPANPDESVEAAAVEVLNDLRAGKISIGDLLGPLYVSGKDLNATMFAPPGNECPRPTLECILNDAFAVRHQRSAHDRAIVSFVHE